MPPIGSNTNPTGLDTADDYVERKLTAISDFAGKTRVVEPAVNIVVWVTYNPA
jgi:hypothetical protein